MSQWGRLSATPFVDTKAVFENVIKHYYYLFKKKKKAVVHISLNYKKVFFSIFSPCKNMISLTMIA